MLVKHILGSGVRLVINSIPYGRSVSVGIYVRNGSRDECLDEAGISHFIEHMLFKGTAKRSAAQIAEEMDVLGGQLNAYTSKEYTCYYARVINDYIETATDILSDMFFNSQFSDNDIEKEASVIIEEINMYEDTPDELVADELQAGIWKNNNALGRPILGTADSVSSFKSLNFREYMKSHYRADNTVISVAGNVDNLKVVEVMEKYFGTPWHGNMAKPFEKAEYQLCKRHKTKNIEQTHICMAYEAIPINHKDSYALSVLNNIVGGSMSSRLYQSIREKYGLAYSIYTYRNSYIDSGLYNIYLAVNPEQKERAIDLVLKEIDRLFVDRITDSDLFKSKSQVKSNYLLGLESTINLMEAGGRNMVLLDKLIEGDEVVNKIEKVSLADLYRIAELIFSPNIPSISTVGK